MNYNDLVARLPGAHRNGQANRIGFTCPLCSSVGAYAPIDAKTGAVRPNCPQCFKSSQIAEALKLSTEDRVELDDGSRVTAVKPPIPWHGKVNGFPRGSGETKNGKLTDDHLRRVPPHNLEAEQSVLGAILLANESIDEAQRIVKRTDFYREAHREIYGAMLSLWQSQRPIDTVTLPQALGQKFEGVGGMAYIAELASMVPTALHIPHYAGIVRDLAVKRDLATKANTILSLTYDGVSLDALIGEAGRLISPIVELNSFVDAPTIPFEGFDAALVANEAYLQRVAVVENFLYSHAVSMITGGKHAGKSTLARWLAICVAKGWEWLKRPVLAGPVIYIASEDETMPARQELLRLGWHAEDPLRFLSSANSPVSDPLEFLRLLTDEIKRSGTSLVVLDMLFDFVTISDELSYAGTREAVGKVQAVASATGTHIVVLHHAPKHAQSGDAAVAALGSQGLAARVSPIVLVRRFGPGVHSVTSTSVRDPRGEALIESRLLMHEDGSLTLGGVWKNYMLAEVYTGRVLDMLGAEEGAEMTASDIATALDIPYEVARATLSSMYKNGLVQREGSGKKGKPYRYCITATKAPDPPLNTPLPTPHVGKSPSGTTGQLWTRPPLVKQPEDLDEYGIPKGR